MQKPKSFFQQETDNKRRKHLKIEAFAASSQDFNQSIYRTLTRAGETNFWSSGPSDTANANEHLIYSVTNEMRELEETKEQLAPSVFELGAHTIFYSFTIANFDPRRIQMIGYKYPPRQVQFEVGFSSTHFHYKSPIFNVHPETCDEQEFIILPEFVIGTHFKVNLIGKPAIQDIDNKHYIALRYVGASGMAIAEAMQDQTNQSISSAMTAFCIKASELSQSPDEEDEGEGEVPTLTYDEMKNLMSKLSSSGEEMYKLRGSILFHLDRLFEDGQIDFQLVNNILQYSFSKFAYFDSVTTELITRIIFAFHNRIDSITKQKEATNEKDTLELKNFENQLALNKHQIITTLQITKHYYVKTESSVDIKPKIAKLVFDRAMNTDFMPAIGMYGELLRCFRQIKLGM